MFYAKIVKNNGSFEEEKVYDDATTCDFFEKISSLYSNIVLYSVSFLMYLILNILS